MKRKLSLVLFVGLLAFSAGAVSAQNLLQNGNLDDTQSVEIVAGFFLPKPAVWQNIGSRAITGPYEDEMSSEPWAGPAPTPVTTGGSGLPSPDGCNGLDCAVFFKAFSGNTANGAATGHLQQAVPGVPGKNYVLSGWAGAEANFMADARLALDFLNSGGTPINSVELNLNTAGLFVPNGQPFNYKQYTISGVSPAGTTQVRARASMINGVPNPAGGGQAFVVDDFTLTQIPEPMSLVCGLIAIAMSLGFARRR